MDDHDLPLPPGRTSLPPAPVPNDGGFGFDLAAGPGGPGGPGSRSRRTRVRGVIGSVAVVLLLVVGSLAFLFTRPSGGTALALTMSRGQHLSYGMTMTMKGTFDIDGQQVPLDGTISADFGWTVLSVDGRGVATVEVTMSHVDGSFGGQRSPSIPPTTIRMRIAPDGEILSAGDLGFVGGTSPGTGLPGGMQFTPILPDGPVSPGDTWSKSFQQPNPFGSGSIRYETHNRLVRYETVDGVRMAVIQSTMSIPFDMTVDFDKLLQMGGTSGDSAAQLAGVSIDYSGDMHASQTAWLDASAGELSRSHTSADFDFTMTVHGLPPSAGMPTDATATFSGTMTFDITPK